MRRASLVSLSRVEPVVRRVLRAVDRRWDAEIYWGFTMGRRLAPRVASGTARVGVVAAGLLFGTKRWHRPITLRLDGPRGPVRFQVPDHAAFKVLHEMFVLGEYDLPMEPTPKRILDLGANIGASVLFFQRRWPDARVVAVEASPHLAALLTRNVAGLNVEVRHAAVAAQAGTVRFAASDESWAGSVGGDGGVVVPAVTLDELLEIPADLVKVDVEGAEFEVLAAATRLDRVRAIVGEAHALPDAPETRALLDGLEGFEVAAVPAKGVFTLFTAVRPSVRVT